MSSLRILIVDDEQQICAIFSEYLDALGHRVDIAHGGREALARISGADSPYDVAVVDWHMPDLPGSAVVNDLAQNSPRTTVLVSTGRLGVPWNRDEAPIPTPGLLHKP
ncbi:MAG: response regulator, partial [Myxococcota bacterium]|nr:response regulator [Myxococcota bacterium]